MAEGVAARALTGFTPPDDDRAHAPWPPECWGGSLTIATPAPVCKAIRQAIAGSAPLARARTRYRRRVIARGTDRAAALALVRDWSAVAVTERRPLRDVALATRPELAGQLDEVFSLEAIVAELTPVLDETLAGITSDG